MPSFAGETMPRLYGPSLVSGEKGEVEADLGAVFAVNDHSGLVDGFELEVNGGRVRPEQ
jgi:hypothetical protein